MFDTTYSHHMLCVHVINEQKSWFSPQIRVPAFLDLFMQSLFKPGSKINQDHKHKYIHILAYAASVVETWKKVRDDE